MDLKVPHDRREVISTLSPPACMLPPTRLHIPPVISQTTSSPPHSSSCPKGRCPHQRLHSFMVALPGA